MSLFSYLFGWFVYLFSAIVIFRGVLLPQLPAWFPNSGRSALIILAVLLFCPTVLFDQGQIALAPASFVCLIELLARDPVAALHAALPLLFVAGISLLLDAARRDRACPDDKP